jgi:hypothetical protein
MQLYKNKMKRASLISFNWHKKEKNRIMKKVLLGFGIAMCFSFVYKQYYEVNNSTAEVAKEQGLYIFTDSKPVNDYEYLGTVKIGVSSPNYSNVKKSIINKVKKKHPTANGILMNVEGNNGIGDAIFFEE